MTRWPTSDRTVVFSCGAILLALGLSGCAAGPQSRDADEFAGIDAPETRYVIGPGDSLQIFVWEHEDLSTDVQVRPDGKISTPLVEDLQAAGRTPTQLARDVEQVLTQYVRSPVVTVIMQGFVGEHAQQVRIVGEAVSPQALQYQQGMTLLDVMVQVGGLTEFAAGNRAKIVRKTITGEDVEIKVRLNDLINNGDISENITMRPGDILVIPQSWL
jgi:polysaccharide export outer membrane protein